MITREVKKRNAWLITWESSRKDYLKDLQRPRVVAILKPQLSVGTIRAILLVLFTSESHLCFTEKIGYSFCRPTPGFVRTDQYGIYCGSNPCLHARPVSDLFVETYEDTDWRQTLHWMEPAPCNLQPDTHRLVECVPPRPQSEDVHFDVLWDGKALHDENRKA